jgi:hypothetical protein
MSSYWPVNLSMDEVQIKYSHKSGNTCYRIRAEVQKIRISRKLGQNSTISPSKNVGSQNLAVMGFEIIFIDNLYIKPYLKIET